METMELMCIIALNGFISLCSFITGARVGQKVVNGEPVEMPNLNPVKTVNKAIKDRRVQKEKEAEDDYVKAILHNIDVYDGTSVGQVKVPTRK